MSLADRSEHEPHIFASYDKMVPKHFAELYKSVRQATRALRVIFCAPQGAWLLVAASSMTGGWSKIK